MESGPELSTKTASHCARVLLSFFLIRGPGGDPLFNFSWAKSLQSKGVAPSFCLVRHSSSDGIRALSGDGQRIPGMAKCGTAPETKECLRNPPPRN